jgi:predicted nucleic-acid-binding protein
MRAADTNVVVRAIVRDDAAQAAKADALGPLWVSHLVLQEVVWVLSSSYRFDWDLIERSVEMLLLHRQFVLEAAATVLSALELFRENRKVGFNDCLLIEVARAAGHEPFMTFDRALVKVDGAMAP